jgi:hypothetical protein
VHLFALLVFVFAVIVAHPWLSLLLAFCLLGGAIIFGSPTFFPYSFNSPSSQEKVHDLGGFDVKFIRVAGPSSYPNPAGIVLTPGVFGLRAIEWSCPAGCSNGAHDMAIDGVNGNIHVIVSSTGLEIANATNLSGEFFFFLVAGLR